MKHPSRFSFALRCLLFGLLCSSAGVGHAAEPFRQFLDGLRENGYHQQALDYLESMRDSSLISDQEKQTISFEQGVTLVAQAGTMRNPKDREKRLDDAAVKLKEFIAAHPQHSSAIAASTQLGNVLVERGRTALLKANAPGAKDAEALRQNAKAMLAEAEKVFSDTSDLIRAELEAFKKAPPKNSQDADRREKLYGELYQSEFLAATILYEQSKAEKAGSNEHTETLKKAAAEYARIYDKLRKRAVGLLARLYEGRAYQDLGDTKKALEIYVALMKELEQADDFRLLRAQVTKQALEVWNKEKQYAAAIKNAADFATKPRGRENEQPDWVAMRYLLAEAYQKEAAASKDEAVRKDYNRQARALASDIVKVRGEHQDEARELLAALGADVSDSSGKSAKTFSEAIERGKSALDLKELASTSLKAAKDPKEIEDLNKQIEQQRSTAQASLELALKLADSETTEDEINQARYFLCYLLYDQGDFWEAAILGEFVARKYPKSSYAQSCATIAMSAYRMLYQNASENDFEAQKVADIATFIAGAWPRTSAADNALYIQAMIVVRSGDPAQIPALVEKISADSPRRGEAELMAGQALWASYLAALRKPQAERPPNTELKDLVQRAESHLTRGVDALRKIDPLPQQLAFGVLALAQLYAETEQPAKAIEVLEDPEIGGLTLVRKKNPAAARPGYDSAVYMAALRAYISADQFDQAIAIIDGLEKSVGGDEKAAEQLTVRLMALGQAIEQQVANLRSEPMKMAEMSAKFAQFLNTMAERETGTTFNSLNWLGASYESLGGGLTPPSGAPPAQAKEYFGKAATAFAQALEKAPNAELAMAVRIRMASVHRRVHEFDKAIALLVEVLRQKPTLITAQIEAAETFAQWAEVASEPKHFDTALRGDNSRNIWGWNRIASTTMRQPKFRDTYHQASHAMATVYYREAQTKSNDKALLNRAKQQIYRTFTLFPEMGGDQWESKYDDLLKRLQTALGEPSTGLQEFRSELKQIKTAGSPG